MKRNILLLLCLLAGINAFAYDAQIDGIYYNFSGDEATVTYLIFNDSHNSSAYPREVVIPSSVTYYGKPYSVTSIGDYAFYYCSSLRYITIPGSVTSIGNYAFYNCSRLTSVTIQDGVTSIGNCAFYQCSDLTFITIPDGVTSIGYNAFSGTKWYNYQPDGMVYVGKVAYKYKGAMPSDTSITLEEGTLEISGGAFEGCSGLTSVTIPNSVTSIGESTFRNCSGLTSITIPGSVTSIGSSAFYNCYNLTSITIPESVTSIGSNAFSGTAWYNYQPDGLVYAGKVAYIYKGTMPSDTQITLEEGTVGIANYAFNGRKDLTSVTIPNSVTSIGQYAFAGCSGLTSITIPNSVTSIGYAAFSECTGLTSITLPNSVTSIGGYAFAYNRNLTSIIIPNSVTSIGEGAFECTGITSVIIPDGITSIEPRTFYGSDLTTVTIPNSVTNIGASAFEQSGLTSVTIGSGVKIVGDKAFYNCNRLTAVHITDLVAWCNISFGKNESQPLYRAHHLYLNGEEIKDLVIPDGVTSIRYLTFDSCSGLTSVSIPNSVTSIGVSAFWSCTGLTSITIPNSVTSIGSSAFSGCSGLTDIYCYADSVPTAGTNTFTNYTAKLHVPTGSVQAYKTTEPWSGFGSNIEGYFITFADDNVKAICVAKWDTDGDGELNINEAAAVTNLGTTFKSNKQITSFDELKYFTGLTSVGSQAFYECRSMTSIIIPENVTSIGQTAFWGCSSLTSVNIPSKVTTIGKDAFAGCTALTAVNITDLSAWCNISFVSSSSQPLGNAHKLYLNGQEITKLNTPSDVIKINNYAFRGCTGLTSVVLSSSVLSIGERCFGDCSGLTDVYIPSSVTSVGSFAFYNCTALTDVYCYTEDVPNTNTNAFTSSNYKAATLHVLDVAEEAFRTTLPWKDFGTIEVISPYISFANQTVKDICIANWDINGDGEMTLEEAAAVTDLGTVFKGKAISSFDELQYFTGLTSIGNNAFQGCSGLTSITIPENVTSIGRQAFSGCSGLTAVHITDLAAWCNISADLDYGQPLYFAHHLYLNDQEITNLVIPNSVTSIGVQAFRGCSGLTSITIPNSVTSIGGYAFAYCI